jgi:NAD(P)-dependent dehydrogenase (short-subunit alcohol dehydrogenase family)
MQITGKTFVITGGASGLGRASAEAIVAAGGNVVLLDVNAETGKAAAQAIGSKAKFAQADVTSEEQVKGAIDVAVSSFGGLHGALNAPASVPPRRCSAAMARIPSTVRKDHQGEPGRHLQRDQSGRRRHLAEHAARHGRRWRDHQHRRRSAAFDGQIGQPAYAPRRAASSALTLPVAREFASLRYSRRHDRSGHLRYSAAGRSSGTARVSLGQQVPFPSRLGRPAEYGASRVTSSKRNVNGEVIRIDGAPQRLAPKS